MKGVDGIATPKRVWGTATMKCVLRTATAKRVSGDDTHTAGVRRIVDNIRSSGLRRVGEILKTNVVRLTVHGS